MKTKTKKLKKSILGQDSNPSRGSQRCELEWLRLHWMLRFPVHGRWRVCEPASLAHTHISLIASSCLYHLGLDNFQGRRLPRGRRLYLLKVEIFVTNMFKLSSLLLHVPGGLRTLVLSMHYMMPWRRRHKKLREKIMAERESNPGRLVHRRTLRRLSHFAILRGWKYHF